MKKLLVGTLFLSAFAFLIACGGGEGSGNPNFPANSGEETTAAADIDGKAIYTKNCVTCHGVYGDMGASGAFNLKESQLALEERINVITNGRNTMLAFNNVLSEEEIQAVAEYTMTLSESD